MAGCALEASPEPQKDGSRRSARAIQIARSLDSGIWGGRRGGKILMLGSISGAGAWLCKTRSHESAAGGAKIRSSFRFDE